MFDQTVSFCLLAEPAHRLETQNQDMTRYIRPQWDENYRGLLSSHKLMLNLQQMELAHIQQTAVSDEARLITYSFSLEQKDEDALSNLKTHGRTLTHIEESWFDEYFPEQNGRAIRSLAVKFKGLENTDPIAAELIQISHKYLSHSQSVQSIYA